VRLQARNGKFATGIEEVPERESLQNKRFNIGKTPLDELGVEG